MGGRGHACDQNVGVRLAPLEASRSRRALSVISAKLGAVLVSLPLEPGRGVSIDRLIENDAIQLYVSQLRKAMRANAPALEIDPKSIDANHTSGRPRA